jgi:hypothetical protein
MHLPLSPEAFERLLKLAYLGEAVLNDWTPDEELTQEQRAATDLLYDLCTQAAGTPSAHLVMEDEETGEWIPSHELRKQMHLQLGTYDNDIFWDELVHRLTHRDMSNEYGHDNVHAMPDAYRKQAESPLLDYYWKEVRTNGIDRFHLPEEAPPAPERRKSRKRNTRSDKG